MSKIRTRDGCVSTASPGTIFPSPGSQAAGNFILWLRLAAAPTFAAMALLCGLSGGGPADILCLTADHASPLTGMTAMYALMSAFHLPPWLTLTLRQRGGTRR
jgi:hypothetical protein